MLTSLIGMGTLVAEEKKSSPNIIYILADDLGYGDVQCLNPKRGKIPTPNMDALAANGMIFTDAHSTSAVCTPSRYSVLTGRYAWRTRLQMGVQNGFGPALIAPKRLTVPAMLKQHGYATACIGKWHLGMDIPKNITQATAPGSIENGPITRGFDYFFGISASLDMAPYAFIENDRFTESPSATKEFYPNRMGPAAPSFHPVQVLPALAEKAGKWINDHKEQPYFLYLPLNSPHTPLAPTKEWAGKSGIDLYADFVMQTDAVVGSVVKAVKDAGQADNTLIIFTSDNGCAPYIGDGENFNPLMVKKLEAKGHFPSGDFRGYKADAWEGGHHIPHIVQWTGTVKPGTTCSQLIGQNDLMATCASIVGAKLPDNAGEDSVSFLPLLKSSQKPVRESLVHHSLRGKFVIRQGDWKLLFCKYAGGFNYPKGTLGPVNESDIQLYNLRDDLGETKNLQATQPEKVKELTSLMHQVINDGRSTPGEKQKNDVQVKFR